MARKKIVARNPLSPRETIAPEHLRPPQTTAVELKETKKQGNSATGQQTPESQNTKPTLKRYATYLRPESIRKIKHYSIDKGMTDYEVVQAAVDNYFKAHSP